MKTGSYVSGQRTIIVLNVREAELRDGGREQPDTAGGCVQDGLPRPVPIIGAIFADSPYSCRDHQRPMTLQRVRHLHRRQHHLPNRQDILGLIAKSDVLVPEFAPDTLTWYSATVAMTGQWRNGTGAAGTGTLNFFGSTATKNGGSMSALFTTRNYNYDPTLAYLQPPFFPVITVNYDVLLFREITRWTLQPPERVSRPTGSCTSRASPCPTGRRSMRRWRVTGRTA